MGTENKMSRREALKRMGVAIIGGVVAASGLVPLASCGNYDLTSNGVKMEGDCEFCFACIQNCPQRAIQFTKSDDGSFPDGSEKNPNARYRNEHVSLMDLKLANNQKI